MIIQLSHTHFLEVYLKMNISVGTFNSCINTLKDKVTRQSEWLLYYHDLLLENAKKDVEDPLW
jgi:hypothetical protein